MEGQKKGVVITARTDILQLTISPAVSDRLEIQGCVLGILCGAETWTRVAGPIPPAR